MQPLKNSDFLNILDGTFDYEGSPHQHCYFKKDGQATVISIMNREIIGHIQSNIKNSSSNNYIINLVDLEFKERVSFSYYNFLQPISIKDCKFHQGVSFGNCEVSTININNSFIPKYLSFTNSSVKNVIIQEVECKFLITNGDFGRVYINSSKQGAFVCKTFDTLIDNLEFAHGLSNWNILLEKLTINVLHLNCSIYANSSLNCIDIQLHQFYIEQFRNFGRAIFKDVKVLDSKVEKATMNFKEFTNLEQFVPNEKYVFNEGTLLSKILITSEDPNFNLRKTSLFKKIISDSKNTCRFYLSHLGEITFENIPFKDFDSLTVKSTNLSSAIMFNSSIYDQNLSGSEYEKYELFNGLILSANNTQNKSDIIEYQKFSKKFLFNHLVKSFSIKKLGSLLSLSISLIYSNFQTSWAQSFFITTPIFGFIFFTAMMLSSKFDFIWSFDGFQNFISLSPYYLQFLNPIHKLNFMDSIFDYKLSVNVWFVLFDSLGRIFVGIGIYETIRSFRKFTNN